ncbi:MAG: hypothetical protein PWP41_15 [Moorella sp. (in: firmicutes)]|nr:hypothetical protein [Moorella sp. (in: firmicutes)]
MNGYCSGVAPVVELRVETQAAGAAPADKNFCQSQKDEINRGEFRWQQQK